MFEDDLELISQALENTGKAFGSHTRIAFMAAAKEIRRLKRCKEEAEAKARRKEQQERALAMKMQGLDDSDDIPF